MLQSGAGRYSDVQTDGIVLDDGEIDVHKSPESGVARRPTEFVHPHRRESSLTGIYTLSVQYTDGI